MTLLVVELSGEDRAFGKPLRHPVSGTASQRWGAQVA